MHFLRYKNGTYQKINASLPLKNWDVPPSPPKKYPSAATPGGIDTLTQTWEGGVNIWQRGEEMGKGMEMRDKSRTKPPPPLSVFLAPSLPFPDHSDWREQFIPRLYLIFILPAQLMTNLILLRRAKTLYFFNRWHLYASQSAFQFYHTELFLIKILKKRNVHLCTIMRPNFLKLFEFL